MKIVIKKNAIQLKKRNVKLEQIGKNNIEKVKKISPAKSVRGEIEVPADKSLSHRALIFAAISEKKSKVNNILDSDDIRSTFNILKLLGTKFEGDFDNLTIIPKKLKDPKMPLFCGNSGTTARLMTGLLAPVKGKFILYGDESLSKRPMTGIIKPIEMMGAEILCRDNKFLPMVIKGKKINGIEYELTTASAQIKSGIILSALSAKNETVIKGKTESRDHSERLLKYMNADIKADGGSIIITPSKPLKLEYKIPGDISSAAFLITLAVLHKNAKLTIKNVLLNETRIGLLNVLKEMNANIRWEVLETEPEPCGNVYVESSKLNGIFISQKTIPYMIDELPLMALIGSQAEGKTIIRNAKELRIKETDRIHAIIKNMEEIGIKIKEYDDGFEIDGPQKIKGGTVTSFGDHRIAMMFAVAGALSEEGIEIKDSKCVSISYPGFFKTLKKVCNAE